MSVVLNTRRDLSLPVYRRVAWQGEVVKIGSEAYATMRNARERFNTLINNPEILIYGVTTGYAQNAGHCLSTAERTAQAATPPTAPDVAWGEHAPKRVVRGILLGRLANFLEGHAAISPEIALEVAAMLDGRDLSDIPIQGHGGAGEILALSPLFRDIANHVTLAEKDSLSLINGAPVAASLTADAALANSARLDLAVTVFGMAIDAFGASADAYDPIFEVLWGNPDEAWALKALRAAVDKVSSGGVQAPVSFRVLPRMIGQMRRASRQAREGAQVMLRAVTDNPVIHSDGWVLSNGGFHSAHAPAVMDALTSASASLCILISRLATRLSEQPGFTESDRTDGLSSLTFLPMAILGYEEEARSLATASLPPSGEAGGYCANDFVSPVFPAWSKQERAGHLLESALAALIIISARVLVQNGVREHSCQDSLPFIESIKLSDYRNLPESGAKIARQLRFLVYR